MEIEPIMPANGMRFYAKLRAEGTRQLFETGRGTMYLGFHLDPLYRVHWNNEVDPVEFEITVPDGVTVTPSSGQVRIPGRRLRRTPVSGSWRYLGSRTRRLISACATTRVTMP